jgi:hypothetical protein
VKVIIAGSRHMRFEDRDLIPIAVKKFEEACGDKITEVVCGLAKGADTLGKRWAILEAGIPVRDFPADWNKYGKGACPIRNAEMVEYMQNLGKPCYVVYDGVIAE